VIVTQRAAPVVEREDESAHTPPAVAMIVAVVAMARIDAGWADAAALALLVIVAAVLLLAISRRLRDDDGDHA
jgi:hypothetical protein